MNVKILNDFKNPEFIGFCNQNPPEFLFCKRFLSEDKENIEIIIAYNSLNTIEGIGILYFKRSLELRGSKVAIENLIINIPNKKDISYIHTYSAFSNILSLHFPELNDNGEDTFMVLSKDTYSQVKVMLGFNEKELNIKELNESD